MKLINRQIEKGNKINTVVVTKTVSVERNYNEILDEEKRLLSYIHHLELELQKAHTDLEEIQEIKLQIEA